MASDKTTLKGMNFLSEPFELLLDMVRDLQDRLIDKIENQEQHFVSLLETTKSNFAKELNHIKFEAKGTRMKVADAENEIANLKDDFIHLITKNEKYFCNSLVNRKQFHFPTSATSVTTDSVDITKDTFSKQSTEPEEPAQISSSLPYSSTAQRMMQKMGYKAGNGLCKYETGRVDIIEASKQRGQRGLGLKLKGLEYDTNVSWEDEGEVMIRQDPDWIPDNELNVPSLDELYSWVEMGSRKEAIDDETEFIEGEILQGILENKSLFDNLAANELTRARSRANPYEQIRGVIFQNRAAMKMAEVDASFGYMFTSHEDRKRESSDLLYFADICAGPGGFSEYVLWREKWRAKGFGFTLRASWANDFNLDHFIAGTPETFDCHYGVDGYKGDGDIFNDKNITEFTKYVKENSDNKGVHFVMADGEFSVEGKENIREILLKQLYLCQFTMSLSILRTGGHFVCKLFDILTPFSIGLVYILYRAFEKVCIFKPVTSLPANSERYVICKGLRKDSDSIRDYMFDLNVRINNLKGSDIDIRHVVPLDMLKDDKEFFDYMFSSNNQIGARQILGLKKLVAFIQNTNLTGPSQAEVKKQCLEAWKIPKQARAIIVRNDPEIQFNKLKENGSISWMKHKFSDLTRTALDHIKSIHDYKCVLAGGDRVFLFSLGRSFVFQWNPVTHPNHPHWTRFNQGLLELPRFSLIEAEFVMEYIGDGRGQRKNLALHITDVIYVGDEYVGDKAPSDRCKYTESFAKALSKPCRNDFLTVRAKPWFGMNDLEDVCSNFEIKQMKKGMERRISYPLDNGKYFTPMGIYFIRRLKEPWHLQYSRTSKKLYFYNSQTNVSKYEGKKSFISDVKYCTQKRLFWEMGKDESGLNGNSSKGCVSKDEIIDFVHSKQ